MKLIKFKNSILNSATYLLYEEKNNEVWLIDCGDIEPITSFINTHHANINSVFLTHTHYDHIYGLNSLYSQFPHISIYTNKEGIKALYDDVMNLSMCYDVEFIYNGKKVIILKDNDTLLINGNEITIYETPGHDVTCLTYKINDMLFTGDSYIPGCEIVTIWKKSNKIDAINSKDRILSIKEIFNLKINPGHI